MVEIFTIRSIVRNEVTCRTNCYKIILVHITWKARDFDWKSTTLNFCSSNWNNATLWDIAESITWSAVDISCNWSYLIVRWWIRNPFSITLERIVFTFDFESPSYINSIFFEVIPSVIVLIKNPFILSQILDSKLPATDFQRSYHQLWYRTSYCISYQRSIHSQPLLHYL